MENLIKKVKEKREFSGLPDGIISKVLEMRGIRNKTDDERVKLSRAFLRKYFGVFMTNKVLKTDDENILESHISSKKRNYVELYERIFGAEKFFKSVVDLGCGVNGFSYKYLREFVGDVKYVGLEATKQLVDKMNYYFDKSGFVSASSIWCDLFDLSRVGEVIKKQEEPRIIFAFQVLDALESVEGDFSKKLLLKIKELIGKNDRIVLSFSMKSISGRTRFQSNREWVVQFLRDNFTIADDFSMFDERFVIVKK